MGVVGRPAQRADGDPEDLALVRRLQAGDHAALDDLYERYRRPAFVLARRILGDNAMAEDVLQEVFLSVWRDPAAFDRARGSFSAWLLAMVHHKAVDAVRREESHRRRQDRAEGDAVLRAATDERDVADEAWRRVVSDRVRRALAAIPDAQREALTLAYYGGYTQREIAALTGAPLGTVKTRMLAGMHRLRDQLGSRRGAAGGGALHDTPPEEGATP